MICRVSDSDVSDGLKTSLPAAFFRIILRLMV